MPTFFHVTYFLGLMALLVDFGLSHESEEVVLAEEISGLDKKG